MIDENTRAIIEKFIDKAPDILIALGVFSTAVLTAFNLRKTAKLATSVNGKMGELIALTEKSSHAEGVKDEKERIHTT